MINLLNDDICPKCKTVLNACTGVTVDEKPSPGDITICYYCGAILKFSDDMTFIEFTKDDYENTPKETLFEILMIQKGIQNNIITIE